MIQIEQHLRQKRQEIIWALDLQDYTDAQIGRLFNISRVKVKRILNRRPEDWKNKWIKDI